MNSNDSTVYVITLSNLIYPSEILIKKTRNLTELMCNAGHHQKMGETHLALKRSKMNMVVGYVLDANI